MKPKRFYIGYIPNMPPAIRQVVRPVIIAIVSLAALLAVLFVTGQGRFGDAVFEFGNVREFSGTIQAKPIPFLIVESAKTGGKLPGFERVPLVAEGKFGADSLLSDYDGKNVRLKGTLIYRDDLRMIEVVEGSVEEAEAEIRPPVDVEVDLGTMTLRGEVIDSKCYLGVMNPGNHKTHKSCAIACIRGGVPPMFLVKDGVGNASELWLLDSEGEPVNESVLDYVAEPVEFTGSVRRRGNQLFFRVDTGSIRRLL